MADPVYIITLAEYKALTGDVSHDTQVSALIPVIDEIVLKIRGAAWPTAEDTGAAIYEQSAKLAAAEMIRWKIMRAESIGLQSESFGGQSLSVGQLDAYGYPVEITGKITQYMEVQA